MEAASFIIHTSTLLEFKQNDSGASCFLDKQSRRYLFKMVNINSVINQYTLLGNDAKVLPNLFCNYS